MKRKTLTTLSIALLLLAVGQPCLSAATIGYWRFENGNFLGDSSGNGYTLSDGTSTLVTQTTPLPGAGTGSHFYNPIPQTGAANNGLATKGLNNSFLRSTVIDLEAVSATQTYTFEMLFNITEYANKNSFLASYYNSDEARSWVIQITETRGLNFQVSNTGVGYIIADSGMTLDLNTDYYLGVVVDLTSAIQAERSVTFYLQDLTNGSALFSTVVDDYAPNTTFAADNTGIALGTAYNRSDLSDRIGVSFDEVRFSNTALSEGELLASVPEPSASALLAGLIGIGLVLRRRATKP